MTVNRLFIALSAMIMCAGGFVGCTSIRANVDVADDADFSQYKTFSQAPVPTAEANLPGYSEIQGQRLQGEISTILEARGFQAVADAKDADFLVSFSITGQPRSDVWGTSGSGWGRYGGTSVMTTHYVHGNLTINIYDAEEHKLVWHGWTTKDYFAANMAIDDGIDAVQLILADFPPGYAKK